MSSSARTIRIHSGFQAVVTSRAWRTIRYSCGSNIASHGSNGTLQLFHSGCGEREILASSLSFNHKAQIIIDAEFHLQNEG